MGLHIVHMQKLDHSKDIWFNRNNPEHLIRCAGSSINYAKFGNECYLNMSAYLFVGITYLSQCDINSLRAAKM